MRKFIGTTVCYWIRQEWGRIRDENKPYFVKHLYARAFHGKDISLQSFGTLKQCRRWTALTCRRTTERCTGKVCPEDFLGRKCIKAIEPSDKDATTGPRPFSSSVWYCMYNTSKCLPWCWWRGVTTYRHLLFFHVSSCENLVEIHIILYDHRDSFLDELHCAIDSFWCLVKWNRIVSIDDILTRVGQ